MPRKNNLQQSFQPKYSQARANHSMKTTPNLLISQLSLSQKSIARIVVDESFTNFPKPFDISLGVKKKHPPFNFQIVCL